jgi:hypothetical protein
MQAKIEEKLAQAKEQLTAWQQQQLAADEQVARWAAVVQVCEELLADEATQSDVDAH